MRKVDSIAELRRELEQRRQQGSRIGLVPTMGYFHRGHISLMEAARKECDTVVVSLFINPTQFGEGEDLDRYPTDLDGDTRIAEKIGVDYLFCPTVEDVYPEGLTTTVKAPKELTSVLCGAHRGPEHFDSVATVVAKLFNMVQPDTAYFGQKDAQQLAVIRKISRDLNFPVEIVSVATVRERDGLAMSSRNSYLSEREREQAPAIYRALKAAEDAIAAGNRSPLKVKALASEVLTAAGLTAEYFEIARRRDLQPVDAIEGDLLIAVAVQVGSARLIDNLLVKAPVAHKKRVRETRVAARLGSRT